jgi:hypothetical protein
MQSAEFSNHQGRANQLFALLGFGLDCRDGFRVCCMVGKGKLDKDPSRSLPSEHFLSQVSLRNNGR